MHPYPRVHTTHLYIDRSALSAVNITRRDPRLAFFNLCESSEARPSWAELSWAAAAVGDDRFPHIDRTCANKIQFKYLLTLQFVSILYLFKHYAHTHTRLELPSIFGLPIVHTYHSYISIYTYIYVCIWSMSGIWHMACAGSFPRRYCSWKWLNEMKIYTIGSPIGAVGAPTSLVYPVKSRKGARGSTK